MARAFSSDSAQYLLHSASAPVVGYPATLMCWVRPTVANQAIVAVGAIGGSTRFQLNTDGQGLGIVAAAFGSGSGNPIVACAYNEWHHAAGVFASTTSRTTYVDGAGDSATSSITVGPFDHLVVGARYSAGTRGAYLTGRVAELAIFDQALPAEVIAAIAARLASPLDFASLGLVFYAPLHGQGGASEPDHIGGRALTVTGATYADHPPIVSPFGGAARRLFVFGSPPAEGSGILGLVVGATATGHAVAQGAGQIGLALSAEAVGATTRAGAGVLALALDASAAGHVAREGGGELGMTLGGAAVGHTPRAGAGVLALSLAAAAAGETARAGSGTLALQLGLVGVGDAPDGSSEGAGVLALQLGAEGVGYTARQGAGEAAVALAADATGYVAREGSGALDLVLGATAVGDAPAVGEASGSGVLALLLDAEAVGATTRAGAGELGLVLGGMAHGHRESAGAGLLALVLAAAAEGRGATVPVNIAGILASGRAARVPARQAARVPGGV